MHRFALSAICLLALTTALPVEANGSRDSLYFIIFKGYTTSDYTYAIWKNTKSIEECCRYCADDKRCVAWVRDSKTGDCALKADSDTCVAVVGADSGVKYVGKSKPDLHDNNVGAYVYYVKEVEPYYYAPKPAPKRAPARATATAVAVASASASSSSSGGPSSARAVSIADGNGVYNSNHVSGKGYAYAYADNGYVSLSSTLTGTGYGLAKYVQFYYSKTKVVATCKTVRGKTIAFVVGKNAEPRCYSCPESPCVYKTGYSYYTKGEILVVEKASDVHACCRKAREYKDCQSWYYQTSTGNCVLNKNVASATAIVGYAGYTVY